MKIDCACSFAYKKRVTDFNFIRLRKLTELRVVTDFNCIA